MKKNIAFYILGFTYTGVLIFAFYKLHASAQIHKIEKQKMYLDSLTSKQLQETILEYGSTVEVNLKKDFIVTDSNNNAYPLEKIIKDKMVVYRLNETNCMTCVEKYIPYLNAFAKKIGRSKVVILGSFSIPRNLFLTLKNYQIANLAIYNLKPSYMQNEKIDLTNEPYVFVMDNTFKASKVIIPKKEIPQLSEYYKQYLFSSQLN